jgi:hypothetical protein
MKILLKNCLQNGQGFTDACYLLGFALLKNNVTQYGA